VDSTIPVTRQLIDIYDQYQQSVVSVEEVAAEKVSRYGIVGGDDLSERLKKINIMIEKPDTGEAPSNLAFAGRYILTSQIFTCLEETSPGKHDEIQLTDAMNILLQRESIYALRAQGKRHDIGNKMDYLKTIVEFGLKRPEFAKEFRTFLKDIIK
jgi:UTP--glucose-1-phosphate uridylyltransferase